MPDVPEAAGVISRGRSRHQTFRRQGDAPLRGLRGAAFQFVSICLRTITDSTSSICLHTASFLSFVVYSVPIYCFYSSSRCLLARCISKENSMCGLERRPSCSQPAHSDVFHTSLWPHRRHALLQILHTLTGSQGAGMTEVRLPPGSRRFGLDSHGFPTHARVHRARAGYNARFGGEVPGLHV